MSVKPYRETSPVRNMPRRVERQAERSITVVTTWHALALSAGRPRSETKTDGEG